MIDRLLPADAVRPTWSTPNALVYGGGLVTLLATVALLGILGDLQGDEALVGYAAIAAAASFGIALVLQRGERDVAAGVAVTLAVLFLTACVGAFASVVGLLGVDENGYQPGAHLVEIVTFVAAFLALRSFRAPLLVLVIALTFWIAIVELASSAVSWDDADATVSLAVGAVLALAGRIADNAGRQPYGFWLHVVGGVAFGGGVLALVTGGAAWPVVGVVSLLYIGLAHRLERSSYAVLGAIGIVAATAHLALGGFEAFAGFPFGGGEGDDWLEPWQIAICFVCAGLVIGLLGLVDRRIAALLRR